MFSPNILSMNSFCMPGSYFSPMPAFSTPPFGMLTASPYLAPMPYWNSFAASFNTGYMIGNMLGNTINYMYNSNYVNYSNPFSCYSYNTYPNYSGLYTNNYSSIGSYPIIYDNYQSPVTNYDSNIFKYTPSSIFITDNSDISTAKSSSSKKSKRKVNKQAIKTRNTKDVSYWSSLGYNKEKGEELAGYALSHARGFIGYCAKYVKNAIYHTGLGEYEMGNASDMLGIMRRNKNFCEISSDNVDVNNLPAGCVLVYAKGAQGYSTAYGHTEITTGDGRGVSDGITNELKKPTAIFMPIAA